jgi:hypothetical protein
MYRHSDQIWVRTDSVRPNGKAMVLLLQVRVSPAAFTEFSQTVGATKEIDPHYTNDVLEWRITDPTLIKIYGVLCWEVVPSAFCDSFLPEIYRTL